MEPEKKTLKYGRPFRFRQFEVYQDRCAMKVGTDGVLLGAWAPVAAARRILDVGTGTGLVALMLAQRNEYAAIEALEIDSEAALQAAENFARSPWAARLSMSGSDFSVYLPSGFFDHIVCNPPYFRDSLLPQGDARSMARHEVSFSFDRFFEKAARWLTREGKISLIFPAAEERILFHPAVLHGFNLEQRCRVYTGSRHSLSRVLLTFSRGNEPVHETGLQLHDASGKPSEAYRLLTSAFYLQVSSR